MAQSRQLLYFLHYICSGRVRATAQQISTRTHVAPQDTEWAFFRNTRMMTAVVFRHHAHELCSVHIPVCPTQRCACNWRFRILLHLGSI